MNIKEINRKTTADKNIKKDSKTFNIVKGSVIAIIITLIGLIIFALVLANTNINENTMFPVVVVITAISILLGSIISVSRIEKKGILNGGIVGLIYIITIYIISSCINNSFGLNLNSCILILCAVIAGMLGGIIGVNIKK